MEKTTVSTQPPVDTSIPGLISAFAFMIILGIAGFQASQWLQTISPYHVDPILPKLVMALFFIITAGFVKRKEAGAPWFINAILFFMYSIFNYTTVTGGFKIQDLISFPPHVLFLPAYINLGLSIIGFAIFYKKPVKSHLTYKDKQSSSININLMEGFEKLPDDQKIKILNNVESEIGFNKLPNKVQKRILKSWKKYV